MTPRRRLFAPAVLALAIVSLAGCYSLRPSAGGGQADAPAARRLDPTHVAVPAGYRIEVVASGLTFPTGVAFDRDGVAHVVEAGYPYGEVSTTPRLLRIGRDGRPREVARGSNNGPWTGIAHADEAFYVAEGGRLEGGRILRIGADGRTTVLIDRLPGMGDHHTNGPAIGPDGMLYFGQGTATNAGVVGADNLERGWLGRFPKFHDIPCTDIELAGVNFDAAEVAGAAAPPARTGAFVPFGTPTVPGQIVKGRLPCSGAVLRIPLAGGEPQLVAWGFRNPFGLAFAPDGQFYVTDNGYDDRGSRPVWATADVLWRVGLGGWHGWPDYAEGRPLDQSMYQPPGKKPPPRLLARAPGAPPRPAAILGVHASSNGLDFSRSAAFGHVGQAFIAEFGGQAPDTGKVLHQVGFRVVRVDVRNGRIEDFAVNRGRQNGPASKLGSGGLERPVAARFDPSGNWLYVVDFGIMLMDEHGPKPQPGTGALWRITREAAR